MKRICLIATVLLLLASSCSSGSSIEESDVSNWIALPDEPHPMNLSVVPGLPMEFTFSGDAYTASVTAPADLFSFGEADTIDNTQPQTLQGEGTLYWESQDWDSQSLVDIVYCFNGKPCGYALIVISPVSNPGNGYFTAKLVKSVRFVDSKGRQMQVSYDYCVQCLQDAKDTLNPH